ncbi:MAG: hypothetical protein OEY59_04995 [Deltaproteobacteria bacterium]|nr:hypothetical protein [Deltaproteobacteria bacterium]
MTVCTIKSNIDMPQIQLELNRFYQQRTQFRESLYGALLVSSMKRKLMDWFLNDSWARTCLMEMKDSRLGFQTDRTLKDLALNSKLRPYPYQVMIKACSEALLEGYALTGEEFRVKNGDFEPTAKGLFNKIQGHPDVKIFSFQIKLLPGDEKNIPQARLSAFLKTKDQTVKIGSDRNPLVIQLDSELNGATAQYQSAAEKLFKLILEKIEKGTIFWPYFVERKGGGQNAPQNPCVKDPVLLRKKRSRTFEKEVPIKYQDEVNFV